jgi:hypothetical protein
MFVLEEIHNFDVLNSGLSGLEIRNKKKNKANFNTGEPNIAESFLAIFLLISALLANSAILGHSAI